MNKAKPILILLDDDNELREAFHQDFESHGFIVFSGARSSEVQKEELEMASHALIDMRMDRETGIEAIKKIRELNTSCKIIVMTGYGSIATAVEATKLGATQYLTKPVSVGQVLKLFYGEEEQPESLTVSELSDERSSLAKHEQEYIEYVLTKCNGNITHAAQWLGIRRQSLQRKLKKYPPRRFSLIAFFTYSFPSSFFTQTTQVAAIIR